MSALDDLKDRIDSAIYTNTEQNITGDGLQTVLDDMVDTMGVSVSQNTLTGGVDLSIGGDVVAKALNAGYQYMGAANPSTNPGNPDSKVFYIAIEPGTYQYFDNLVIEDLTILYKDGVSWSRQSLLYNLNDAKQDFIVRYSSTDNLLDYKNQINGISFDTSTNKLKYTYGKRMSHLIPVNGATKMTFSGFSAFGDVAVFLSDYNIENIVDWFNLNNGSVFVGTRTVDVPTGSKYVLVTMGVSDSARKVAYGSSTTTDEFALSKIEYVGEFVLEYLSGTDNILTPGSRTDIRITDDNPYFVSPSSYSVTSSVFIVRGLKRMIIKRNPSMVFNLGSPYLAFLTNPELKASNVISIVDAGTSNTLEISVPSNANYAVMMLNTSMDRSTAAWDETTVSKANTPTTDDYTIGNACKINGKWISEYQQTVGGGDEALFTIEKTETEKRAIPYSVGTPGGDVISFDNSYDRFNMLLFTDNHIDTNDASLENVVDVAKFLSETKMKLNCALNCGDFITPFGQAKSTAITGAQKFFDAIKTSAIPVMQAIGNHDVNDWTNPPQNIITDEDWSQLYYSWMAEQLSTVHDNSIEGYKSPYFYKDFDAQKIRVICLNAQDIPHEPELVSQAGYCLYYGGNAWYIRQQQFDWFVNTALDFSDKANKNWGVIVFMHQDYRYGVSQLGGTQIVAPADGALRKVFLTLKALNTQTSYLNNFVCEAEHNFDLDIDADFTSYSGASQKPYVIAVLVGHEHYDANEVYEGINLIYTGNGSATMVSSDARVARVVGTTTQNLFDIFSIDTTHRKIYATRYGAGLNCYGVGGDRFKPDGLSF